MIFRPEQIRLMRLGLPATLANGGSDSDSQANTTNNTTNTNFVDTTDRRIVASDQAVALNGDGNLVDRSNTSNTNTNIFDSSDKSTKFSDTSNRSTTFTDNSDRSTSIVNTTTDFGSISASLSGMERVSKSAIDVSDHSISGAISSMKNTSDNGMAMVMAAFNNAARQAETAQEASKSVMDFSNAQLRGVTEAFSMANNPNNETTKTTLLGLIAAVAVVGVAVAMTKG